MKYFLYVVALIALLNLSGFSYRTFGWLSDADYLAIATDREADANIGKTTYVDGQDLIDKNPNCCQVNRFGEGASSLFSKLLGWNLVGVKITYRADRYKDYPCQVKLFAIDTTGKVRNSTGDEVSSPTARNYLILPD